MAKRKTYSKRNTYTFLGTDHLYAAEIAHAVFGGLKLSERAIGYIYSAQLHYGCLEVESALDGRDLFEKGAE